MRTVELGEVVDFDFGFAFDSGSFNSESRGLPLVRIRDVTRGYSETFYDGPFDRRYLVAAGDLLVGMDGEFNLGTWAGPQALLNQRVCRVAAVRPIVDRGFLRWALSRLLKQIEDSTPYVTVKHLSAKALRSARMALPPIEEQGRIAAILDKADDLRAKRRAALAHLDSLTQSIFLDMFGDTEVNHYGWPTAPLSSLVRPGDHIGYGVIQPGSDVEHGVPLIRVGDLADGRVGRSQLKRIDPAIEEKYPRSRLRGDEVLLSCVGSIGIVALASPADRGCNIARAIARVPLRPDVSQIFGAAVLSTGRAQRHFAAEVRTSSQPTLNIKQIGETPVILPPSELRQRFDRRVKEVDARLSDARVHAAALATLMSSLQHRAFSGAL